MVRWYVGEARSGGGKEKKEGLYLNASEKQVDAVERRGGRVVGAIEAD